MTAPRGVGVVVVAAGSGERLGSAGPKALVELAGSALVRHAVDTLLRAGLPPPVVVHPPGAGEQVAAALDGLPLAALVTGGATRTDSVRAGVAALATDVEVIVVHDAARPRVPAAVVRATLDAVEGDVVAAAPAIPVADTVKRVDDSRIVGTLPREDLRLVQTPQVFLARVLQRALAAAGDATDELALVEELVADGTVQGRIVAVAGSELGRKVTFPSDLDVLEALSRTIGADPSPESVR